jgi:hypothetical protein
MTLATIIGGLKRARQALLLALCKLNEIQFEAPWAPRRNGCSGL